MDVCRPREPREHGPNIGRMIDLAAVARALDGGSQRLDTTNRSIAADKRPARSYLPVVDETDDGLVGSCEVCDSDELWETDEEPAFFGVPIVVWLRLGLRGRDLVGGADGVKTVIGAAAA